MSDQFWISPALVVLSDKDIVFFVGNMGLFGGDDLIRLDQTCDPVRSSPALAELFCGDIGLFCGNIGLFGGDARLFCGDVGLLCRDMGLFCGEFGLFCRDMGFFGTLLQLLISTFVLYVCLHLHLYLCMCVSLSLFLSLSLSACACHTFFAHIHRCQVKWDSGETGWYSCGDVIEYGELGVRLLRIR